MSGNAHFAEPVKNMEDYVGRLEDLAKESQPTVFGLKTRLPTQGRADMPVAGTPNMSVVLKAYASGGENEVHAHPNEDHIFIVLQGSAHFYNHERDIGVVNKHQGVMIPRGAYYMFEAGIEEPLVMLRVGALTEKGRDPNDRLAIDGSYMDGFSKENKEVALLFEGDATFE